MANNSPKYSTKCHHEPKISACKMLEINDNRDLTKYQHEGNKEDTGIDIVVEGEGPDITINNRENLLGEDGEERHKKRSKNAIDGSR